MSGGERQICVGLLAHVDAGKTTLAEAMLYRAGCIRAPGRVDHGDTALDTHPLERSRGITIFSAQASFSRAGCRFTLLDTPGHMDFSGEMERTLQVLDCAVLVISAAAGVQAHTETLWRLLEQYSLPVFLFVTKMDAPNAGRAACGAALSARLDARVMDFTNRPPDDELALCDEALLERYLARGGITDGDIAGLVAARKIFPCYFGSGLRVEGVDALLDALSRYTAPRAYTEDFGAQVFKISRDERGARWTHLRLVGGTARVRDSLRYVAADGAVMEEKIAGIRVCDGAKWVPAERLSAGETGALLGLSHSYAGLGLGCAPDAPAPQLVPALQYRLDLPPGTDALSVLPRLKLLEEEEPLLRFSWDTQRQEIAVHLMGPVQIEVLKSLIFDRFGLETEVRAGRLLYQETIAAPVDCAGHFSPPKHYAEVHLRLEPLARGRGIELESDCPADMLAPNWQQTVLAQFASHLAPGILCGAPLTDLRITLMAGRAQAAQSTEADFRQAATRALRQGLKKAQNVLLEPRAAFRLTLPAPLLGRAAGDIRAMHGTFETDSVGADAVLEGSAPLSCIRDYGQTVAAYSGGRGQFSWRMAGYMPCHNTAEATAECGYDADADARYPADSVFCAHGGALTVSWDAADGYMDLLPAAEASPPASMQPRRAPLNIDERELEAIMEREFGPIRRPMYVSHPPRAAQTSDGFMLRTRKECVVVDGYNVIFAWDTLKALAADDLDAARQTLTEQLVSYHGFTGSDVVLVFDGYAVRGNPGEKDVYHGVRVVFTKENESADLYIERLLHEIGKNAAVRVVTSDNLIRLSALGSGIRRTSAREFGTEMDWVMGQISAVLERSAAGSHLTRLPDSRL